MAICSFLKSTDARTVSRNHTLIWTEICEIQSAILAAIDAGEYSVIVNTGTPFTVTGAILSVTVVNGGTDWDQIEATAEIDENGTGGTGATLVPLISNGVVVGFNITANGLGYTPAPDLPLVIVNHPTGFGFDGIVQVVTGYVTIAAQDETDYDFVGGNGTFTGGTGYAAADTITLNEGTVITVDTEVGGVVTEFTVTSAGTSGLPTSKATRTQASTSGGGTGFTLTTDVNNESTTDIVNGISIQDGGVQYGIVRPTVTVTTSTGQGATFQVNLINTPDGEIDTIDVLTGGFGYENGDALVVTPVNFYTTIINQDEDSYDGIGDNGTFTGGTGYAALDTITLSDGTIVTVNTEIGGVVTEFTVTTASTTFSEIPTFELTQSSTSGGGTGFTLTTGTNNTTTTPDDGSGETTTLTIDENTFSTNPEDYYNEVQGVTSNPVIADQIQFILDYFDALGYNIRIQVNPATNGSIQWQLIW